MSRTFAYALFVLGCGFAAAAIAGRIGSAWPLEWMEGASLHHALRLLHGEPLYGPPSAEFIPFVYPPLSYLPMALSAQLFGATLWAARIPSLLALVSWLWAAARAARLLQGSAQAGWSAAGLSALGYGYCGGFVDLARVDALFIALIACGCWRLCAERPAQGLACLVLACFAKQHGVIMLAAASCGLIWQQRRAAVTVLAPAWLALGLGYTWLGVASDGWFWSYCLRVPARHGLEPQLLGSYLLVDVLLYLPVMCALTLPWLWRRRSRLQVMICLCAGALLAGMLGRAHPGGDDNVRLPAYALLALLSAAALCDGCNAARSRPQRVSLLGLMALQALLLLQLPNFYWPLPSVTDRLAGLRRELLRCAGEGIGVALDHALLTGEPFVHTLALSDLRMNHDELAVQATAALLRRLEASNAPAALAVSSSFPELERVLALRYQPCAQAGALKLPTGYAIGATRVFRRR